MTTDLITLDYDGPVAIITNNRPDKHNAANDEMDAGLWEILRELETNADVRAIVWQGNGKSWSSGRDVGQIGEERALSQQEFMEAGLAGTQGFFTVPAPIVVALKGWVIGGSFERALLCDMRIAGESTRMMLPEVKHGVVPDSGGTARIFQMAGHGLAADLALTGRVLDAEEALRHGIVSRVVPDAELDDTCLEVAREIAAQPAFAVKMFRRTLARMADPLVKASIQEEAITQVVTQASDDYAEMKAARTEKREPKYRQR